MDEAWTSQPQAERIFALAEDLRPAWLWSGDGDRLLWRNRAAGLFGARIKNGALKRPEAPLPVKGQISRILRLGLVGRPILSRMQFIAGRKPLSATCVCTPLALGEEKPALLVVGADPIPDELLAFEPETEPYQESPAADHPALEPEAPTGDAETALDVSEMPALGEPDEPEAAVEEEISPQGLGALVDRLAEDEKLFAPLAEDEVEEDAKLDLSGISEPDAPGSETAAFEADTDSPPRESDWDETDAVSREEQAFAEDSSAEGSPRRAGLWQLTGRGLTVSRRDASPEPEPETTQPQENLEQVSRYNFEELARILNERVGRDAEERPAESGPRAPSAPQRSNLVSLSEETLVLNRLPLGILIFRDQDILFANRALVDLTGYGSAATVRAVGLAAVIPVAEGSEPAGPVSQLLRRDGSRVAVSARLHTVTWQGRPAMMLSARAIDGEAGREDEIRRFAADFAAMSGAGYIETDRIGIITATAGAAEALPANADPGERLSQLVAGDEQTALARFLALPARFAETERPSISLNGKLPGTVLRLFALGRAGVISGYSAIYQRQGQVTEANGALPAAALGRIGRELRRPLNTIVGFSELIVSESFGPVSNPRYLEYARDINAAGAAITDLADELDDYVRLAEGQLDLAPADIDLSSLLADCLVRVRGQAGAERVLLRSAISERLPMVRADAATLKQAVLNMLASAINGAGEGSKVVLSAQQEDDGTVSVHVRDAARAPGALADQFVVFRDGWARDGTARQPVRSSIGLTLTRTLVAVNACSLSLDPTQDSGTLMTLTIPATLVARQGANAL